MSLPAAFWWAMAQPSCSSSGAATLGREPLQHPHLASSTTPGPMRYGLSGVGDLVLTCTGALSRNHTVGVRLGKGERLEAILASMQAVAEGVRTAKAALGLARRHRVDMPIVQEINAVLFEEKSCRKAVTDLMERDAKPEKGQP